MTYICMTCDGRQGIMMKYNNTGKFILKLGWDAIEPSLTSFTPVLTSLSHSPDIYKHLKTYLSKYENIGK